MTEKRVVAKGNEQQSLEVMLANAMPELQKVAPKYVNIQKLVQLSIEAKMHNHLLASCSPVSVLNFCKKCAETGTDRIGAGGMWAVPFYNNREKSYDMQPIPDWRLLIEKAKKAKCITHGTAEVVYEHDEFSYSRGLYPNLVHVPSRGKERGKIIAGYFVYTLPDGTRDFCVMDMDEDIIPIRDGSQAWKAYKAGKISTCPWVDHEGEMVKKTVAKRGLKVFEGASIELTALIDADNIVNGFGELDLSQKREPVSMPKAVTPTSVSKNPVDEPPQTAEKPPEQPVEGEISGETTPDGDEVPDEAPRGVLSVSGLIERISEKSGGSGNKKWTKWGILIEGEWYGTFDSKIAEICQNAHEAGEEVSFDYEINEKGFRNIVS